MATDLTIWQTYLQSFHFCKEITCEIFLKSVHKTGKPLFLLYSTILGTNIRGSMTLNLYATENDIIH